MVSKDDNKTSKALVMAYFGKMWFYGMGWIFFSAYDPDAVYGKENDRFYTYRRDPELSKNRANQGEKSYKSYGKQ